MCWPADNVTALASLLLHDELEGTDFRPAFDRWKQWTLSHSDPMTRLPAGQIDSRSGALLQPSRGCANSWIAALLPRMDPAYAREFYRVYASVFQIRRLGFAMFREYPAGSAGVEADVDSGPIIWGAGVVATGAGLAAALANGDLQTAEDIHGLAAALGLKRKSGAGFQYLFGRVPVGDAFLAYGWTLPRGDSITTASNQITALWSRRLTLLALTSALGVILAGAARFLARSKSPSPRD